MSLPFWHRRGMPRAYSLDLRERLLRAKAAGLSAAEIEHTTGVSASTVHRWQRRVRGGASLVPGRAPGRALLIGTPQEDALRGQVAAHPDATLAEHCARWATDHGVRVSRATMCRRLTRLDLPLKKRV